MIGYAAMCEQFHPADLVRWSKQAEDAGFGGVMVSDHFHPWVPGQGQSAFAFALMGAIGQATSKVVFGPGVTPPGYRYHPAIVAQAAATLEAMFPGRFYLGLGAGEALNEHIIGGYWPEAPQRLDRLMDSIDIIKKLFSGKVVKHKSDFFNLESARLYMKTTFRWERLSIIVPPFVEHRSKTTTYGGFGGSPSGYAELQQLYSKAPLRINVTQFKLAEYDRAMEQFLKSADDEVQIAAARAMSEIARTYMPEMPAVYRLENYFVHGWVRGFAPPIFTSYWKYLDIDLAQRRQAADKTPR